MKFIIILALAAVILISGCTATANIIKEGCSHDWVSPQPPVTSLVRIGTEPNADNIAENVCLSICVSRANVKTSRLLDSRFVEGEEFAQCQCDLNDCFV